MSSKEEEMVISIRNWVYTFNIFGDFKVFTGAVVQYDEKRIMYRESDLEYRFVSVATPGLADAHAGDIYRIRAKEVLDPQYGYQWQITSAERIESAVVHTIQIFLAQTGGKYLTPKRRHTLIKAYGEKLLDTILTDPSALDVINAPTDSKRMIRRIVMENRGFATLLAFLAKRGWDCRWALPLYNRYQDNAISTLRTNPYVLYDQKLTGFRAADQVFLGDGGAVDAPLRCRNAVTATLRKEAGDGGVFISRDELRGKIAPLLWDAGPNTTASNCTISEDNISKALDWLEESGEIHVDQISGKEYIYPLPLYDAEVCVTDRLKLLCQTGKRVSYPPHQLDPFLAEYSASRGQRLTPAQCEAVKQMLTAPVSVITGGPGTGKTSIIEAAIAALQKLCPHAVVQCCAPTGKAATRMPAEASTIDRLYGNEKWKRVNQSVGRDPDIVFVDEVSMVSITLFAELLEIIPAGARLVLIGDQDQLPSIEAGQVLRDLIDSGVIRTIRLREVFRQNENSDILPNAEKAIRTAVDQDIRLDEQGDGFAFNKYLSNPHKIPHAVIQAIELALQTGMPLKEIKVITMGQRGERGAGNFNHLLQDHFNPQKEENRFYHGSKEFRLHDPVIHIKNNYDKDVFNGEVGEVIEIQHTKERALTVQYPGKTVHYSEKDLAELELAYALTAHKCQGSEFEAVIIPIAGKGITRRWLYTAETRGKKLVLLIGTEDALTAEMRGETTDERASHLALRLRNVLPYIFPEMEQMSMFPTAEN